MADSPLYEHDCDRCVFLGTFTTNDRQEGDVASSFDLYVCGRNDPTVIARASSDPPDYGSGLLFGWMWQDIPANKYGEAFRRAKERGLIGDAVLKDYERMYGERIYSQREYDALLRTGRGK